MEQEKNSGGGLRELLTILFKHRSKIILSFLATVITVTVGSYFLPHIYEARSTLIVKIGRENVYRPEVGDNGFGVSFNTITQEQIINSEIEVMTSQDLMERVITTLGVEKMYPELIKSPPNKMTPLEAAIVIFQKSFYAGGVKKSSVIEASFQHKNPQVSAEALNLLIEYFKEKHLEVFSNSKSDFMSKQRDIYSKKLEEAQNKLEAYKQKNRVVSLYEQKGLLLKQRVELDTSYKTTQNRMQELRQKISSLQSQMETIPENIPLYSETGSDLHKIVDATKVKLLTLKLKEQELLGTFTEKNRQVVNVRKEIQLVKDFLEEQEESLKAKVRTGKNTVYQQTEVELIKAKAELNSLDAKGANIRRQLSQLDREMKGFGLRDNELRNLNREVAVNERHYETYLNKLEEARISEELDRQKIANIGVIQKAVVPTKPVKPKKRLNVLLSMVFGSFLGLGLAFFSEFISQGLSTPENAEKRLGLSNLTTIPYKK